VRLGDAEGDFFEIRRFRVDEFEKHGAVVEEIVWGFAVGSDEGSLVDHGEGDFPVGGKRDVGGDEELVLDLSPDLGEREEALLDGQNDVGLGLGMHHLQDQRARLHQPVGMVRRGVGALGCLRTRLLAPPGWPKGRRRMAARRNGIEGGHRCLARMGTGRRRHLARFLHRDHHAGGRPPRKPQGIRGQTIHTMTAD